MKSHARWIDNYGNRLGVDAYLTSSPDLSLTLNDSSTRSCAPILNKKKLPSSMKFPPMGAYSFSQVTRKEKEPLKSGEGNFGHVCGQNLFSSARLTIVSLSNSTSLLEMPNKFKTISLYGDSKRRGIDVILCCSNTAKWQIRGQFDNAFKRKSPILSGPNIQFDNLLLNSFIPNSHRLYCLDCGVL